MQNKIFNIVNLSSNLRCDFMIRLKLFSLEIFCLCALFCCFSCADTSDLYNESDFLDSQTLRKAKQEYDVLFRGLSDYDSLYANPQWDSYRKLVDSTDVVSYYVFLKNDVRRYKSHLIINRKDVDVSYFIFNLPSAYENIESYMSQKIPKAVEFARDKNLQGWYLTDTSNVKIATRVISDTHLYFIPDDGGGGGGGNEPWGWNTDVYPFGVPEVVITTTEPADKSDSNTSENTDYTPPAGLDNVLGASGGAGSSLGSSSFSLNQNSLENGTGDVDPCAAAQKLSRDAAIRGRISELFSDVLNYRVGVTEYGWVKTTNGNILRPTSRKEGSMSYSPSALAGAKITERYHTHPGGGAPFPSWGDLIALSTDYKNGRIDVADFSYGVISIYGCFSIVITSENAFERFANKVLNTDAILAESWDKMLDKSNTNLDTCIGKYINFLTSSSSGLEVLFCPAEIRDDDSVTWGNWKSKTSNAVSGLLDNDCGSNK